jgi:branched-chain amino acid transport system permease protein
VLHLKVGFLTAFAIIIAASLLVALVSGLVVVRLTEAYFVITTAIFAAVAQLIANDLTPITGGTNGVSITVPGVPLGPVTLSVYDPLTNYYLVVAFAVGTYLLLRRLLQSPLGKIWRGIRENESRLAFVGYNVYWYKLAAFVVAGVLTSVSGALYAIRLRYTSTDLLSLKWSVLPIIWTVLGGPGTLVGPCLAVVLLALFEYFVSAVWSYYLIVVGILLILVLRFSRGGIMGYLRRWLS